MASAEIPPHYASSTPVDVHSIAFLSQMAELVPGIIYVFNHQSMSNEYSNRSIAQMLGYSPEEIKAMGEDLLPTIVHPDDFDRLADHVGSLQELAEGEQAVWEYRALRQDGKEVWLRSIETVFTRSAGGGVLRHIGIAFDITTEKNAEIKLQQMNEDLERRVTERTRELKQANDELAERVAPRTGKPVCPKEDLEQPNATAKKELKSSFANMGALVSRLDAASSDLTSEDVEMLNWMRGTCEQVSEKLNTLVSETQAKTL